MSTSSRPGMTRAEAAALLGVPETADRATAQHAYLRLARQVHPDAAPQAPDAAARFDALSRARAVFDGPAPARTAPPPRPEPHPSRQPPASVGNALLVLVLLVFLLVALVTLDAAIRTHGFEEGVPAAVLPAGVA